MIRFFISYDQYSRLLAIVKHEDIQKDLLSNIEKESIDAETKVLVRLDREDVFTIITWVVARISKGEIDEATQGLYNETYDALYQDIWNRVR